MVWCLATLCHSVEPNFTPRPLSHSCLIFSGHPKLQTSTYSPLHNDSRTLHDAVERVATDNA